MKIAEIISKKCKGFGQEVIYFKIGSEAGAAAEILALIPANMEVPALEDCAGPLSIERRNLILGRNAGLDEVRKAMEVK